MSLEENKAVIRKGIEAVNERNLALLNELMASDFLHACMQLTIVTTLYIGFIKPISRRF